MKLKVPSWLTRHMKDTGHWDDNLYEETFPLPEYTGPDQIGTPDPLLDRIRQRIAVLEDEGIDGYTVSLLEDCFNEIRRLRGTQPVEKKGVV
jgi:hypothetical protein